MVGKRGRGGIAKREVTKVSERPQQSKTEMANESNDERQE